MATYYIIFILFCFQSYIFNDLKCENKQALIFFNFIGLWVIFATKFNVGTDSENYLRIYNNAKFAFQDYGEYWLPNQEFLYYSLNLFSAVNGYGTIFIYTVCGLLISYFTFKSASLVRINPLLFLTLVFPTHIVMMAISGIRQGVAESIIYFGFSLLCLGRKKSFLLCVIVASGFHSSAMFFLPLYFSEYKKRYLFFLILLLLPVVIASADADYGSYLESGLYNQGVFLRLGYLLFCVSLLVYALKEKLIDFTSNEINLAYLVVLSFPFLLMIAILQTTIADRLSYYFIGLTLLLLLRVKNRGGMYGLLLGALMLVSFLSLIVFLVIGNNGVAYYYDSYLFHLFSGERFLI